MLLKAPAYLSLHAANADGKMDEREKETAIKLAHIKTFSSKTILHDYYVKVEEKFNQFIEEINQQLPNSFVEREAAINKALKSLEPIFNKLDKAFALELQESLKSYEEHVSKAHRNILTSFIIPFYIKGLNE